jgi:tellurite methyltransferase
MSSIEGKLPKNVKPYKRTPEFTEQTVPDGLTRDHSTKAGIWGVVTVVRGKLRYIVPSADIDIVLDASTKGIISPQEMHHVEPIGKVAFFVEFWK